MRFSALIFTLAVLPATSFAQAPLPSRAESVQATPANDGVLAAFQRSPLVGLSDDHGLAQEDFYVSLLRDPRFAREVGNVVVEFGNASQQQTIDRYVNGESLPYVELRSVWGDTSYVGWFPTVTALGYLNFFAAVRAVNAKLPVGDRIRVWLGGQPVNWSKIKSKDDLAKAVSGQADRFTADLIEREILGKHKKALLIYGTFHFFDKGELAELLRQRNPGSLFVITPYVGFADWSCSQHFELKATDWPVPALVEAHQLSVRSQTPGTRCKVLDASAFGQTSEARKAQIRADMESQKSVLVGDAMLYLARAEMLTKSPLSPDLYLDPEFRKEIDRRAALLGGEPDSWPTVGDNPVSPQVRRNYGPHSGVFAR